MLRKTALWICCIVSLPAFGAVIDLETPALRILSMASVKAACDGKVDTACTTFLHSEMTCFCEFTHGRWAANVNITAQPSIVLSHQSYLHHEMSHVFDFKAAMTKFAEKIEDQAFQSQKTCETFALDALREFPQVLRDYQRVSMFLRDGMIEGR